MLQVTLLGKFETRLDGKPVALSSQPAQVLLAYLLLNAGVTLRREQLAGLLWPDSLDSSARKNLRNTLWLIRKTIGDQYLLADKTTLTFAPTTAYELDVAILEQAVESDDASLVQAVSAYGGDLLPGYYEDWVQLERERLRDVFERRMQMLLDRLAHGGQWSEVQRWAEHWISLGYVPEPAYRALMMSHAAQGDLSHMASAYRRCVKALQEMLDVSPSTETQALYQRLSQGEPPIRHTLPALPPPAAAPHLDAEELPQEIQFCVSADAVRIAYATVGQGPPLVKAANWLSHLEFDWQSPVWRHWVEGLARYHRLIRYDERGCGLSDWHVPDMSFAAWLNDLEAVVEAAGVDRFPLLGMSQGGAIAIAYAVRYPERVSHLILYGSYARGKLQRNPSAAQVLEANTLVDLIKIGWGLENPAFRQVFAALFMPDGTPEQIRAFTELQRVSSSPENAARIVSGFNEINVTDLARRVTAPTLVLHARDDGRIPFEEGRLLAALIPNARFVPLESKNHVLLADEPAWQHFLKEFHGFLEA
jgi:DNA-binding SARP family transcriptional activator/pimeloyl-ACP methyl ester carboxylesterase